MIEVLNLDSFDATVQGWFKAVEAAAAEAAVGLAHEAFEQILETSPQFSGDFAANWTVATTATASSFQPNALDGYRPDAKGRNTLPPLFQMGSSPAMDYARSKAKWPKIKLGESLFLTNSASHEEPYAFLIEHGLIRLRPVNEGAEQVVARAASIVGFTYHNIGSVKLSHLRKFGV